MNVHRTPSSEKPRKAYRVSWTITNDMEALVYADSAADALERFGAGDVEYMENTGNDRRSRQPRAQRERDEDR